MNLREKLLPCKKCKSKDSVKYNAFLEGEEVVLSISECSVCKYKAEFTDIYKYL